MRVIFGVSGGIAAYKAATLLSRLVQRGHDVQVLMTAGATQFVTPLTFEALSGRAVGVQTTDQPMGPISHVKLGNWAEVLAVVPATVGILSRMAIGQPTDLLSLTYMSYQGPVVVAPAMEPKMWQHPQTVAHCERLKTEGVQIYGPMAGHLASGETGWGRLIDTDFLVRAIEHAADARELSHTRVLITGASTWEHFDPVRALTNPSTGMMGFELAQEAAFRGAQVIYVHGPGGAQFGTLHPNILPVAVTNAKEMYDAVFHHIEDTNIMVSAAAVSDFRPERMAAQKLHKDSVSDCWQMIRNPDILQDVGQRYGDRKFLVGFAAETENVVESALKKLERKRLDLVVANQVGAHQGFGSSDHRAHLLDRYGGRQTLDPMTKEQSARIIWDRIIQLLKRDHNV